MLGGPTEVEVYHAPYKEGPGMEEAILYPLPPPPDVVPRRLTDAEAARVDLLSRLLFFLTTAPAKWTSLPQSHFPDLSKFRLPNGEDVACVLWNSLYHITGTDIVRALLFRFEAFGRPVKHTKKWEEGVFSDLRNLKPGADACLEEPKSAFLDFLFRNGCIRTQKKQKVFFWFSVPHDRLFLDALERDLKREKAGQEPTSVIVGEPARSFKYDPRRGLYEQFMGANRGIEAAMLDQVYPLQARIAAPPMDVSRQSSMDPSFGAPGYDNQGMDANGHWAGSHVPPPPLDPSTGAPVPPEFFPPPADQYNGPGGLPQFTVTMFEGSTAYKRKRVRSKRSSPDKSVEPQGPDGDEQSRDGRDSSVMSEDKKPKVAGGSRSSTAALEGSVSRSSVPTGATEDKTFVCVFEFCRRPFKRLEHLKRHIRTHTQERPFVCKMCARAFSRQDNLLQHLRLHRKDDPPRAQDAVEDRLSAPPYVGRRWPTQSPAPSEDMIAHVPQVHNGQYSSGAVQGYNNNMAFRSTTVPPDWLSMPPPYFATPASSNGSSAHPSFSPAPAPMRFRSATPQMAPASTYSYGSMPPPPAPGLMQNMPAMPAQPSVYPVYSDPHAQAQEYGFVPAASGWIDPNSSMPAGESPVEGSGSGGPPPPGTGAEMGGGSDAPSDPNTSWQSA